MALEDAGRLGGPLRGVRRRGARAGAPPSARRGPARRRDAGDGRPGDARGAARRTGPRTTPIVFLTGARRPRGARAAARRSTSPACSPSRSTSSALGGPAGRRCSDGRDERSRPTRRAARARGDLGAPPRRHRCDQVAVLEARRRRADARPTSTTSSATQARARGAQARRLARHVRPRRRLRAGARARAAARRAATALGPASLPRLSALVVAVRDAVATRSADRGRRGRRRPPGARGAPLLLIVEDDLPLAERLAAEAARRGMRVELAASPSRRARRCSRAPARTACCSTSRSRRGTADAYALLSELTGATPPVPVLVSTMRDTLTDRVEVVRRGGRGFVTKSLPPPQVDRPGDAADRAGARAGDDAARGRRRPGVLDAVRALLEPHGVPRRHARRPAALLERARPRAPRRDPARRRHAGRDRRRAVPRAAQRDALGDRPGARPDRAPRPGLDRADLRRRRRRPPRQAGDRRRSCSRACATASSGSRCTARSPRRTA